MSTGKLTGKDAVEIQIDSLEAARKQFSTEAGKVSAHQEKLEQQISDLQKALRQLETETLPTKFARTEEALDQKYQLRSQLPFPSKTEIIRAVLPMSLAGETPFIDVGDQWTQLTPTIYTVPEPGLLIPGTRRVHQLVIRSANQCVESEGDFSKYRALLELAKRQ